MRHSFSRLTAIAAACLMSAEGTSSTGGGAPAGVDPAVLASKLSEYDIHFLVDKSGSMNEDDPGCVGSRWERMEETLTSMAYVLGKVDTDGIDVTFFSGTSINTETGVQGPKVKQLFKQYQPGGDTPLDEGLKQALTYAGKSPKKDLIVVFTDGAPRSKPAVEQVIRDQAAKQTADDECTILFIQIGYDAGAKAFLEKLDDNLNAKFDIVDFKTQDEADKYPSIPALLLDAISG